MQNFLQLHESPDAFRQALAFTEIETGFAQRLIEKDYFCSLVLADFEPLFDRGLVFKGGTSLSKYHAGFYRLSEDLDFAISASVDARRSDRREMVSPIKQHLKDISDRLPTVQISDPLRGHNDGRQYNATLLYKSVVTGEDDVVKVQVAIREPFIELPVHCRGRTLLRHPLPRGDADPGVRLLVLSLRETYAEKVRAAITRTPPAIRDIYDIDDAVRTGRIDIFTSDFLALVRKKLAVSMNSPISISVERKADLRAQLESALKPVLRARDYNGFAIERALDHVDRLIAMLA